MKQWLWKSMVVAGLVLSPVVQSESFVDNVISKATKQINIKLDALALGTEPSVYPEILSVHRGDWVRINVVWPGQAANTIKAKLCFDKTTQDQDPFTAKMNGCSGAEILRETKGAAAQMQFQVSEKAVYQSNSYNVILELNGETYIVDPQIKVGPPK